MLDKYHSNVFGFDGNFFNVFGSVPVYDPNSVFYV